MRGNKGISLAELLAGIVIFSILASIVVSQYKQFKVRSRHKEGITLLNNYYSAAKSSLSESGLPGNFVALGFNPSGQVHYRVTAQDGTNPPHGPNDDTCVSTETRCGDWGAWREVTAGSYAVAAANSCSVNTEEGGAFTACASAVIRENAGLDADTWSITDKKILTHENDGSF